MKTVSFDDEAYRILKGLKISPKDSFSDVVKRHLGAKGKVNLQASHGAWAEVPEDEIHRLRKETVDAFGMTTE